MRKNRLRNVHVQSDRFLHYFVEGSAQQYTDEKYYLEGSGKSETKVIFRPAILTGVDTITTTVKGETVKVVKELTMTRA